MKKSAVRLPVQGSAYAFTLMFDRNRARRDKRTFAIITPDEEMAVDTFTTTLLTATLLTREFRQMLTVVTGVVHALIPYYQTRM